MEIKGFFAIFRNIFSLSSTAVSDMETASNSSRANFESTNKALFTMIDKLNERIAIIEKKEAECEKRDRENIKKIAELTARVQLLEQVNQEEQ